MNPEPNQALIGATDMKTPEEFRAALRSVVATYATSGTQWPEHVGKQGLIARLHVIRKEVQELADELPTIIEEVQAS